MSVSLNVMKTKQSGDLIWFIAVFVSSHAMYIRRHYFTNKGDCKLRADYMLPIGNYKLILYISISCYIEERILQLSTHPDCCEKTRKK